MKIPQYITAMVISEWKFQYYGYHRIYHFSHAIWHSWSTSNLQQINFLDFSLLLWDALCNNNWFLKMKIIHMPFPFPLPLTICNLPWWVVFTKIAFWTQWTLKGVSTNRDRIFFCKRLAWLTFTSQLQIEITMSSSTKTDSDILYIISYFSQLPIQIKQHNETLLTVWTQIPAAVIQLSTSHISRGKHTLMYRKISKTSPVWQHTLLCKISKEDILEWRKTLLRDFVQVNICTAAKAWNQSPGLWLSTTCFALLFVLISGG